VRALSVARKLSTIEERRQDQSCLFGRGDYRNKRQTPKTALGSSPHEESFCSLKTMHERRIAPGQHLFVSERRLQELRSQTSKLSWVQVSVKIFGLGIIKKIQRYVTLGMTYMTYRKPRRHPDDRSRDADTRYRLLRR
jgi:hypothetical protein